MGYDRNKVSFKEEEHVAAEAADKIYEAARKAAEDGLDLNDLSVAFGLLAPGKDLVAYLTGGSRAEFAKRFIAVGVMLERDNEFLKEADLGLTLED
jgi:hypothetical protein